MHNPSYYKMEIIKYAKLLRNIWHFLKHFNNCTFQILSNYFKNTIKYYTNIITIPQILNKNFSNKITLKDILDMVDNVNKIEK